MKQQQLLPMNLQMFAHPADPAPQDPPAEPDVPPVDPKNSTDATPAAEPASDKKYSDADVDGIINARFAKWQADQEEKDRVAKLSVAEKEQERIAKLEKLEHDVAQRDAVDKSRKMLSDEKLPETFAKFIADTKEDVSQDKFNEFKGMLQSFRESIVAEIMKDKTPAKPKVVGDGKVDGWRNNIQNAYEKVKAKGE
ncbi:MAG: DUF4355 domain-containing protein [Lactococcus raffinolactis]|jgi:hypothetical protein|nr:DUF4355 domain-containing protein [Lactococcus raffinolactis]